MGIFSQTRTRSPISSLESDPPGGMNTLTMPVGNILIGNAGGDIEHDDAALTVDVVTISQATKLFLTRCVPDVKCDLSKILTVISVPSSESWHIGRQTVVNPSG
jgi:hypothetical protein